MSALLVLLTLSDVALATAVFIALSRPDVAIGLSFRLFGVGDDWFQEHLSGDELVRLRQVARLVGGLGVVAVFAWSFMVGALVSALRMAGA